MSIKSELVALANQIAGVTNLTAGSIAGAITLIKQKFPGAATSSKLGMVKVGTNLTVSSGTLSVPDASSATKGVVKQAVAVADAAGEAPTATEYNALLAALRTAGLVASE